MARTKKPRLVYTFYRAHEVWPDQQKDNGLEVWVTVFDSMVFDQGCVAQFGFKWHDFGNRGLSAELHAFHDAWPYIAPAVKALDCLRVDPWSRGFGVQQPAVMSISAAFIKAGFIDRTAAMVEERRPTCAR